MRLSQRYVKPLDYCRNKVCYESINITENFNDYFIRNQNHWTGHRLGSFQSELGRGRARSWRCQGSHISPLHPRFTAVSDALELVGVLNGKQITLYLDRLETNAPVKEAQIELDLSGVKFVAQKHGEGEFEIVLPSEPKPGVISVTATVTIDKEVDLLAGELDIHSDLNGEGSASKNGWKKWLSWALFSAAALMALIFIRKRLQTHQANRTGGAA